MNSIITIITISLGQFASCGSCGKKDEDENENENENENETKRKGTEETNDERGKD